ncbi:hypothetical protein [Bernardetia sp.]|uniref:hypothetical protein n=1 Tax=Bernardetia sp. TaxID=1937974 RepID=UPI0025C3EA1D|nr:hypothetical protein [Bernardetia sp.]
MRIYTVYFLFATILLFILILASCNPFGKTDVMNYEDELSDLIGKLEKYPQGYYDEDEIDEVSTFYLRRLRIDSIIKNGDKSYCSYCHGFIEDSDSLVIFINKSDNMFDTEKRIIYDYKKEPRNFKNQIISGAAYEFTQVGERWYYSETGFD